MGEFADLNGASRKGEEGVMFLRGAWYPSAHYAPSPHIDSTWVFRIKLSFWDLIWTKWNSFQHININCAFFINFCAGDIQLSFNHKIPKILICLTPCLHLFNFDSSLPFFKSCKLNLTTTTFTTTSDLACCNQLL